MQEDIVKEVMRDDVIIPHGSLFFSFQKNFFLFIILFFCEKKVQNYRYHSKQLTKIRII
jgi:hypothetical protein